MTKRKQQGVTMFASGVHGPWDEHTLAKHIPACRSGFNIKQNNQIMRNNKKQLNNLQPLGEALSSSYFKVSLLGSFLKFVLIPSMSSLQRSSGMFLITSLSTSLATSIPAFTLSLSTKD